MWADLDCQIKRCYFQGCLLHTQCPILLPFQYHTILLRVLCSPWDSGRACTKLSVGSLPCPSQQHQSVGYGIGGLFSHRAMICTLVHAGNSLEVPFYGYEECLSQIYFTHFLSSPLSPAGLQTLPHTFLSPKSSAFPWLPTFLHVPFCLQNVCAISCPRTD